MSYKQELQVKQIEAKNLLKSLKKERSIAKKEKLDAEIISRLYKKIVATESQIKLFTPSKYELYRLSNGKIVNLKILKSFIKKMKGCYFTAFQETEEGLVFGYSNEGSLVNGKLTFYALPEIFTTLKGIPEFDKEEWI